MIHEVKSFWNSFSKGVEWLYPSQCALCSRIGLPPVCDVCEGEMSRGVSLPVEPQGSPLDFRIATYLYDGRAAQAVKRLKYERATCLAGFMGQAIFRQATDDDLLSNRIVVPVPIHWTRRNYRGFNQSELLAEAFPPQAVWGALVRTRSTPPQVGLSFERRHTNLEGAFAVEGVVLGKRFLLVDDVVTTGHTARECARALKLAGALEVGILAFAGEA